MSTDSLKIKKVINIRPKFHSYEVKNSKDTSTDYDVVKEFLSRILKIEKNIPKYILYLRPTTPIRSNKILEKGNKNQEIK